MVEDPDSKGTPKSGSSAASRRALDLRTLATNRLRRASGALRTGSSQAGKAIHETAGKAMEKAAESGGLARLATDRLADVGGDVWDYVRDHTRNTTAGLLEKSRDLTHQLVPESRVRAFLLPTGSGPGDFYCLLDFQQIVEELAGGWFRRPCLEVWASRPDVDRMVLAETLRHEFTSQLNAERSRVLAAAARKAKPNLERLEGRQDKAGGMVETATFGLASSLLLMFFIANPIFDLLFLVLAIFTGAGGLTKALHYLQLGSRLRNDKKGLAREQRGLEKKLGSKNKEFRDAITRIDVKVHPVLERIVVHLSDLDGGVYNPGGESLEEYPPVAEHLHNPSYRARTPSMYHPLIDVEV